MSRSLFFDTATGTPCRRDARRSGSSPTISRREAVREPHSSSPPPVMSEDMTTGSTVVPPYPRLMIPTGIPASRSIRQSISTKGVLFVPPRVMFPTLITGITGSTEETSP